MRVVLASLAATLVIAGCGQPASQSKQQPPAQTLPSDSVHGIMTTQVDPYADTIWGLGNAAMDDETLIDPAKMSPEAWRTMAETAVKMADAARALGAMQPLRAVRAGDRIVDDGKPRAPTGVHVQQHLDADPALFRAMARSLEDHGRELAIAARARDGRTAGRLVNEIDGVCESCHLQFWYPEDRKVLAAAAKK